MKQIIVLAAFIALGIFIAGIVMGFQKDVEGIGSKTSKAITEISNSMALSVAASVKAA
ncbi:hypothetical protein Ami103574_11645 [Aminipila butyrica]|uniref:Uncharacterized protein n=1 Tax=Aminipila butyrica TaxID=433296 RepID=A0A858BZ09_9FIRM|nr:hypothetical protein [Aminipila butyrica]QIB69934.1 hypothetical protein Ami103574_11645 [Aminipila butyrica]